MSSKRGGAYEIIVSASNADEAIEIAAEGLSRGTELLASEAIDISAEHGPDSWKVTLSFRGGKKSSTELLD